MAYKLDLTKFRKISSDKHSTLMRHEDGHELKLDHSKLDPKHRGILAKMKGMADGGEVPGKGGGSICDDPSDPSAGLCPADEAAIKRKGRINQTPPEGAGQSSEGYARGGRVQNYADGTPLGGVQEPESQVEADPQAPAEQSPASSFYASDSAPVDAIQPPQPAALPKSVQDTRDWYQKFVTGGPNPNPDEAYGPNGEAPKKFNPQAAMAAQKAYENTQAKTQGDLAANYSQTVEENKARASQGLPPMSLPQAPQTTPNSGGLQPTHPDSGGPKAPLGPNDPYGTQEAYNTFDEGMSGKIAGIQGEANALQRTEDEKAKVQADAAFNSKLNSDNYLSHRRDIETLQQQAFQEYKDSKIDPDRYMHNMGTGQKIATIAGLLIGGFGGDGAMNTLNNAISRDIDAQKADMGKNKYLLDYTSKMLGDNINGAQMAHVLMNDYAAHQLEQAAAKNGGAKAQAIAQQNIGALKMDNAQRIGQMAMRKTILSGTKNGTVAPEMAITAFAQTPAEREKLMKQLQDAQNTAAEKDNFMRGLDRYQKLNTIANKLNPQARAEMAAIRGAIIPVASKGTAGRYTEGDAKALTDVLGATVDSPKTDALIRAHASRIYDNKMNFPDLKVLGIDPSKFSKYSGASTIPKGPVYKKK